MQGSSPIRSSVRCVMRGHVRVGVGGARQPVTAELVFESQVPATVRLMTLGESPGEWVLARPLLKNGLTRPAGGGETKIRPNLFGSRPVVRIRFIGEPHTRLIELQAEDVAEFLYWTHRVATVGVEERMSLVQPRVGDLG